MEVGWKRAAKTKEGGACGRSIKRPAIAAAPLATEPARRRPGGSPSLLGDKAAPLAWDAALGCCGMRHTLWGLLLLLLKDVQQYVRNIVIKTTNHT